MFENGSRFSPPHRPINREKTGVRLDGDLYLSRFRIALRHERQNEQRNLRAELLGNMLLLGVLLAMARNVLQVALLCTIQVLCIANPIAPALLRDAWM